jgi:predicted O-methyltransferase YrrM
LGTYELELHPIIQEWCAAPDQTFLDIGAAEGYYAVGLAFRKPGCKVIAFEREAEGRELLTRLAALNQVAPRIEVRATCTVDALRDTLGRYAPCFILMDAEGAEVELLDLAAVPALRACSILVEVHDFVVAGAGDRLKQRFAASHEIREIWSRPRQVGDLPGGLALMKCFFPPRRILGWMDEGRPGPMRWLSLRPR